MTEYVLTPSKKV